jgi:ribonuclease HI
MWKHFPRATDNTTELFAVTEDLKYLQPQMVVRVSSDSKHVKNHITQWIHKWKRNGWKNARKGGVANAMLWRGLDTSISLHIRVEFMWVHAHSGILLNECADQLATRVVNGLSHGPETIFQQGESASEEEFVMDQEDVAQRDHWSDPEHLPRGGAIAIRAGLAAEELREQQEELLRRFSPKPVRMVSDSSVRTSPDILSENSDGDIPIPDQEDSGVVQAVLGDGFRTVDDDTENWTAGQFPFYEHGPVSNRPLEILEWMTEAGKHMPQWMRRH